VGLKNASATELLKRHLPHEWPIEEELALFAIQPSEKQAIVLQRLEVLTSYLQGEAIGSADADTAAASIGVGRRQFYNLVAKLRQYGPTRALSPGYRNVARRSVASRGLAPALDVIVRQMLSENPDERIARIEEAVRDEAAKASLPHPGESAVRRRVHALRRLPPQGGHLGVLGEQISVDQVNLNLTVSVGGQDRFAIITLIVDHGTRLILGHGLTGLYGDGDGLLMAIGEVNSRLAGFDNRSLAVASKIKSMTWVVPRDLEAITAGFESAAHLRGVNIKLVDAGPRRHGAAILRLVGDRLPPFTFKPMAMERVEGFAETPGLGLEEARRLVRGSIDRWNDALLAKVDKQKCSNARRRRLNDLSSQISSLFDDTRQAIDEIKEMFEESRLQVERESQA
jgi:hypothetical protein